MRGWLGALLLLAGLAPAAAPAQERILGYHADLAVQADGSLEVTETIRVRAEGQRIRRGIYRDFPTRYRDQYGNRMVVDFELLGVERDGRPEPYFTEAMPNGVRINTGNDDFLPVPADYTFSIRYRTTRQIGFFDEHDELYWNVTGLGWDFTIEQASARVTLPYLLAVPAAVVTSEKLPRLPFRKQATPFPVVATSKSKVLALKAAITASFSAGFKRP